MNKPVGFIEWFHFQDRDHVERTLDRLRQLGVDHLRTGISWADSHRSDSHEWFDWMVGRLSGELEIVPCFSYTPPSVGVCPRTSAPPTEPTAYADFVEEMINRHGEHFEWVELWNEPNNRAEWDWTLDPEYRIFARMVNEAADRAHVLGKKVLLGGLSPIDPTFLHHLGKLGLVERIDAVGLHGFPGTWERNWNGWAYEIKRIQDVLDEFGASPEIWGTEIGFSTRDHRETEQYVEFLDALDQPFSRLYWYSLEDLHEAYAANSGFHQDEREYHTGIVRSTGMPKLLYRLWDELGLDGLKGAAWILGEEPPTAHRFDGTAASEPGRPDRTAHRSADGGSRGDEEVDDDAPVMITGGAGFIGTNVANRLLSAGRPVLIFDDLSRKGAYSNLAWLRDMHGPDARVHVASLLQRGAVAEAVRDASAVVHLAAQVAVTTSLEHPMHDFEVNARGTMNLLEALRRREDPPPLVMASTNKVYGSLGHIPVRRQGLRVVPDDPIIAARGVDESQPLELHSPYACSKGAADQYVLDHARMYGLPNIVFRMSCIYGPHQHGTEDQGWVAHFLRSAAENETITIYGDGHQVRDVLYVDDLVDAFLQAEANAERLKGRPYNIGGGPAQTLSLLELLRHIERLEGQAPDVRFQPMRPGDQFYYTSDPSAFHHATGWEPKVGVEEGLRSLHRWIRHGEAMPREQVTSAIAEGGR